MKNLLLNDLITDDTTRLNENKIFLKTSQNSKYAKHIKNYITPKELLKKLDLKTQFVALTGTNGKTTTAFVLGHLLRAAGFNVGVQGTEGFYYNGKKVEDKTLTTPPVLTTIKRAVAYECDFFIMEVSSHAIVQNRIEALEFKAKIFTSFSQDHLDFHKSMEEYRKVKESFFQDEAIKVVKGRLIKADRVEIDGYQFVMNPQNLYVISKPLFEDIPMAGEFNKYNFSLAFKTAQILSSKSEEELKKAIETFKGVAGRMEIIAKSPTVIVDFAHTPDGMEKVLESIKGKKTVVFGTGGERDSKKRPLMGEIADKYADYIILTEDNPRCENVKTICEDIAKGIKKTPYEVIVKREDAIKKALSIAKKNNYTLLILGKGDEKYIQYCNHRREYSDKRCVKEILND